MSLRLNTFGGLSLSAPDRVLGGAAQQRRRLAVLAVLATAGERGMSRARLLGFLWPEVDEARGRQALSQALYALRRDSGVSLVDGGEDIRLDARAIESDVGDLAAAVIARDDERVAALHVGPFLEGVYLNDAPDFERWVDERRARFATRAQESLERLAAHADRTGDRAAAVRWWQRLTELDPLRTRAALGMIGALARVGERAGAIRHADHYARLVREDLGVEPNAEVVALADGLRALPDHKRPHADFAGRYRIEREIGRGGMAVVFLARDLRHDRPVAIKMLQPTASAMTHEHLPSEIIITAGLQHPHILPLFDSGESEGTLYYVMPFVDGETLRTRLVREGPLPVPDVARLLSEIADALHYAHQRGVVHRDIKPENVLLSNGRATVMDFGIARTLAAPNVEALAQHGVVVGTPAYMSPEQMRGDGAIDARSDVYSLACMTFEMLTGRPPWLGASMEEALQMRLAPAMPSLTELRPMLPPALDVEFKRALDPEPSARHQSTLDFSTGVSRAMYVGSGARQSPFLPEPPGELLGREGELATLTALVLRRGVRIVTLTGAGGTGKTRLALRLASSLRESFELVHFVDLSAVTDPLLALPIIANTLGVRDIEGRSTLETLAGALEPTRTLLVLDNLEQIAESAADIARLVAACPSLTIVATSRAKLRVRGEHEFFVAPLSVPERMDREMGSLRASPAVQLFVQRALEMNGEFEPDDDDLIAIAQICARLDGLPLAIELAAARCRLLPPKDLLARLDQRFELLRGGAHDLPSRHQTLEGAIAWSYDLLMREQQRAFTQLATFAGGISTAAGAAVLGCSDAAFLEIAEALMDTSLLRARIVGGSGARFTMLESVREFGRARVLETADDGGISARYRAYFLAMAERLASALEAGTSAGVLEELHTEQDNVRLALEDAERARDTDAFARLVLSVWRFWLVRGRWTEGRAWIARAISMGAALSPQQLARLYSAASTLAQNQGDYASAYESAEHALTRWRAMGDARGEAQSFASMGWISWRRCRFSDARSLSEQSLVLHRAAGDEQGAAQALSNIGWAALFVGDLEEAERALHESLAIRERLGDRRNSAFVQTTLAWVFLRRGRVGDAEALLRIARATFEHLGERQLLAFNARVMAEIHLGADAAEQAIELLKTISLPVFRDIGDRWGLMVALLVLGDALVACGRFDDARSAHAESLMTARSIGDPLGTATALARRAEDAWRSGDALEARSSMEEADALIARIGVALPGEQRLAHQQMRADLGSANAEPGDANEAEVQRAAGGDQR